MEKHPARRFKVFLFSDLFDRHCTFFRFGHNIAKLLIYRAIRTSGCRSKIAVSGTKNDFTNAPGQEIILDLNIVWLTTSRLWEALIRLGQEHL